MLGECADTPSKEASVFFGYWSIGSWIVCYYPQVRINFIMKSAQAVSLLFSISWLIADVLNIISGVLLNAILSQQIIFIYWTLMDVLLLSQFYIYRKNQSPKFLRDTSYSKFELTVYAFLFIYVATNLIWAGFYNEELLNVDEEKYGYCETADNLDYHSASYIVGTVLAYASIPVVGFSRVCQIYKNYKRKSVKGLSLALFISSLSGNISQFISNLTYNIHDHDYIIQKLPYIIGPLVPISFDFGILGQYFHYLKHPGQNAQLNQQQGQALLENQ